MRGLVKRGRFVILIFLFVLFNAARAWGSASAGYSEYYIPGDDVLLSQVLDEIGGGDQSGGMHAYISVTAWSDNTTVYYDHWENGYNFDPDHPATTADETHVLANKGDSLILEGSNIPTNPRGTATYYDGRDYIYVAGGAVTVTRAGWTEAAGTLLAVAWEVYPVRPQLTTYIMPFGEDLAANDPPNLQDFERVYAFVQATADNSVIQVDLNKDGVWDNLDWDRDGTLDGNSTTLNRGDVFLLDDYSAQTQLNSGALVQGSDTLQVQYVIGDEGSTYEVRGLSAFPRGFWDDEYYAPVDGADPADNDPVDIYLYNPQDSTLTITYETASGSGSFTIPSKTTRSFEDATGFYVPQDTAVYLHGDAEFWGVSTIDSSGHDNSSNVGETHDWGYSLVPAFLLDDEHFIGWAPGAYPAGPGADADDSGIYLAPAQDNIRVFIDYDNDGTVDQTYDLDRLQTQYIYDASDGDMSNANIYATGPYVAAYGQNPDTAPPAAPAIDVGYTTIPANDFIELLLTVDKSVSPSIVPTTAGSQSTFTLVVNTYDFAVDGINVTDTLPTGWQYVNNSTTITLPDGSTISGGSANPSGTSILTWSSALLGSMDPNQQIFIVFTAETTQNFSAGDLSRNNVEAVGTRTVEGVTQTFTTTDFAFITYGDSSLDITKTSDVDPAAYPGDTITYTVTVNNPGTTSLTDVSVYDPLPDGVSYVAGSSSYTLSPPPPPMSYFYDFESGAQGFTTGAAVNGTNWELGDPQTRTSFPSPTCSGNCYGGGPDDDHTPGSGVNCWGTDLDDLYANDISPGVYLYSPVYDFTGMTSVSLSFWQYLEIEGYDYDHAHLQRKVGAGAWTDVYVYGDTGAEGQRDDDTWSQFNHDASAYAAGQGSVQWRWMIDSDGGWQWGGWYIDDVSVSASSSGTAPAGDPPNLISASSHISISPGGSLTITFQVTVDDPLATGITEITNTASATSSEIMAPVSASVTDPVVNPAQETATVGDRVWLDSDGDGVLDVGESGIANVEVTLKDQWGTPLQTTTTDSQGYYHFYNVAIDNGYYVEVTGGLPSGLTQTTDSRTDNRTNSFDLRVQTTDNYRDEFSAQSYGNSDGSIDWTGTPWVENDNAGGGASGGNILVTGNQLRMHNASGFQNDIYRSVNIPTDADSATLSFEYAFAGDLEQSGTYMDSIYVEIMASGASGWTQLDEIVGQDGSPSGLSFSMSIDPSHFSSDTRIRFRVSSPNGWIGSGEYFYVDNFDVTYTQTVSTITEYLDADLGYEPSGSTAIIGDLVWSDADGDGVRDPGEPGLSGVTVRLYVDTNGDGLINDGQTPQVTTTGPDGSYLFTGVAAGSGQDYIVQVVQSDLPDYNITAPLSGTYSIIDAAAGGSYLNADFGFQQKNPGTTYSITDRVWLDNGAGGGTADDGSQNGTEGGIAGVTVALLDNSLNIIATTTTASNGDFEFTGVPAGVRYTWRITDQAGILNGYYGTTSSALDGQYQMPGTLTGDLDYTTAPHFGYDQSRSIGDTVFNDNGTGGGTAGDGIQNGTEPGISGVTVVLYKDVDGDNVFEPGGDDGAALGTLVTDADGRYLFTGLSNGYYWVSIDNTQSALTGFNLTSSDDSDGNTDGHQQREQITGGNSNLDADFGYRAPNPGSLSGTIWSDGDQDGVIDAGEDLLANVTVDLLRNGTVVATATTDATGGYAFTGLATAAAPGVEYTVRVTDTNSVLDGYSTTYEKTEGTTSPFNGEEDESLTPDENVGDINFGYYKPNPTLVVVASFRAFLQDGYVVVEWETAAETGTIGFYLERKDEADGGFVRVNKGLIPSGIQIHGATYQCIDKGAAAGKTYTYRLAELEIYGGQRVYGPYTVTVDKSLVKAASETSPALFKAGYSRTPRGMDALIAQAGKVMPEKSAFKTTSVTLKTAGHLAEAAQVKVFITEPGLYRVGAEDIAGALSVFTDDVTDVIGERKVYMSSRGNPVAWFPADDDSAVYFYAEGFSSIYTDQNVYWIRLMPGSRAGDINGDGLVDAADLAICRDVLTGKAAAGIREDYATSGADVNGNSRIDMAELAYIQDSISSVMATASGETPSSAAAEQTFEASAHFEKEYWGYTDASIDPASDFWFWDVIWAGYPLVGSYLGFDAFEIETHGVASSASALYEDELTVNLYGLSNHEHHAVVTLNPGTAQEVVLGDVIWSGMAPFSETFTFNQANLREGANQVEVVSFAGLASTDIFGVDSFDITYHRTYTARNDALYFLSEDHDLVTVTGFTGSADQDLKLFDLSVPNRPKRVENILADGAGGSLTVAPSADTAYLAVNINAAKTPADMVADIPSDLKNTSNAARYLVITADGLLDGAQELADYRSSPAGGGWSSFVASLSDVFDEFNHGIYDPNAIAAFIAYAHNNWTTPPEYVVLVGDGIYKQDQPSLFPVDLGDCFVPVLLTQTPYGIFASDNLYGDVNGDGLLDVTIGRIPAGTAQEMADVNAKIQAYEDGLAGANRHLLMVADAPDTSGNDFPADNDAVSALISPDYSFATIDVSVLGSAAARQQLIDGINNGAWLVNYIGHGARDVLSDIFNISPPANDQDQLTNSQYPVFVALTCLAGDFAYTLIDPLSEVLVLQQESGFIAAWSPSGLSLNAEAVKMNKYLFTAIFDEHVNDLGHAAKRALELYQAGPYEPFMPYIYNLMGDPALSIPPVTP